MKKATLILLLFVLNLPIFSQITISEDINSVKIGEVTQVGVPIISCIKNGNNYAFRYYNNINKANNDYKQIIIQDKDDAIEKLYSLILKGFREKKNNIIKIKTHKEQIGLEFIKSFGITGFRFLQYDSNDNIIGYSIGLSKRQIRKLFNK